MGSICPYSNRKCKDCEHNRYDEDSGRMACFLEQDVKKVSEPHFTFGYAVARIRLADRDVFHCVNKSMKSEIISMQELVGRLTKGEYKNATTYTSNNGDITIRLASGLPTIELKCKYGGVEYTNWLANYIKSKTATANANKAFQTLLSHLSPAEIVELDYAIKGIDI